MEPAGTESNLIPKFNPTWSCKSETTAAEEIQLFYLTKAKAH